MILPVPSLSLRDKLVRRFQHFVLKHRRFDELYTNDPPAFYQSRHFPKRQLQLWREQQRLLALETEGIQGVLARISEGEREHSECNLVVEKDNDHSKSEDVNVTQNGVKKNEETLKKHHLLSSRTAMLSPFPGAARFSDTHLTQTPSSPKPTQNLSTDDMATLLLLGQSPPGTKQTQGRISATRRHSYDPHSPHATSNNNMLPYVSPNSMGGSFSANTNTFQTPPLVGRTSSSNGIFSHGRLSRSVSTVRRSSSSTKGKNSLSEAFSFS